MSKKIPTEIMNKLNKIKTAISDIGNTVPEDMSSTFNFKGRKSPDIAGAVLRGLCKPGDILYDPFMGSGSFVNAAVGIADKIIATELDNYTYSAVCALMENCDMNKLDLMFEEIENAVRKDIMGLYRTECCGKPNYIRKLLFDPAEGKDGFYNPSPNREIKEGRNIKLVKKCPECGKKAKPFDDNDYKKINSLADTDVSHFPHSRYIENSRINITKDTGADFYDRIFTRRSKLALLILQDKINSLDPCPERDVLEQALTASLSLARTAMYGSSTDILYHVVGHGAQEMNVWLLFEKKYNNFRMYKMLYNRDQSAAAPRKISNFPGFGFVHNKGDNEAASSEVHIYNGDYADFIDAPENKDLKVNIIYTDPPYTDQVPYLERNQLYRVWLEERYDKQFALTSEMLDKEIVVTNAPSRPEKRSLTNYYGDIDNMFAHFSKILVDNGLAVFTIKLGKAKYFKTFVEYINLARKNGFEYVYHAGIEKKDPTLKKQSSPANTFTNEIIAVFVKLPESERYWYMGSDNYEFLLIKTVYDNLVAAKAPITMTGAVNLVCSDLKARYSCLVNKDDEDSKDIQRIQKLLKQHFHVDGGWIEIDSNRLYFGAEDSAILFDKLYDLIPVYIRHLLDRYGKFTLEDMYSELVDSLCTGNPASIIQILEDNAHQRDIESLILNYCDKEGDHFVKHVYKDIRKSSAVDVSVLTGTEFEELVRRLLIAEGFEKVVRIGGAGDLGVDVIATKKIAGREERHLIQCKRWIGNVGSTPIQRLYAERERRHYDYAECITTSGYTKDGKLSASAHNIGMTDGRALMERLDKQFPGKYYHSQL